MKISYCFPLLVMAVLAAAQPHPTPPPILPPVLSPEVHPDHSVTFRFRAPNAKEVQLMLEGAQPASMQKDGNGVWSIRTSPLEPDLYGYSFLADRVLLMDPSNNRFKPNLLSTQNVVHVFGPASLPWEFNDVPHGEIHHHFYKSAVAQDSRDFYVYTPPGYDPRAKTQYPALYLLHGFSDGADGWTAVGFANLILDSLIAQGKAKPMIVVMPLGYGTLEMLMKGFGAFNDAPLKQRNFDRFTEALLTEVMPQVEAAYAIDARRESRAIAGLSMGGSESLLTGLNHLDKFAWVGSFSSGGLSEDFDTQFPGVSAKSNSQIKLLWVACGTDDTLIAINRKFRDWLKAKGIQHADIETPGAHTWMVWRRNLATLAPMLFR
jgi:enterochelin esterase family protein